MKHRHLSIKQGSVIALLITIAALINWDGLRVYSWNQPQAKENDRITVRAAGRGKPRINLSDGQDLLPGYTGGAETKRALDQNRARPLALASADFDEDGVPDLISGYAGPDSGIVTLHRGNGDSIYPNSPEARQRKAAGESTDSPFLSPASVFELPVAAEFIGAGDFDGDGHRDVVAAHSSDLSLYLLSGDGQGGFAPPERIHLPGSVTALATGDVNRADGLADIVVGIAGAGGPKLIVLEGPEGALRSKPEEFTLPAAAAALVLGQLDNDYPIDIAVAAGHDLLIVSGRDRKLSLGGPSLREVSQATTTLQSFPFAITSMVVGNFSDRHGSELALSWEDGAVRVLQREDDRKTGANGPKKRGGKITWRVSSKVAVAIPASSLIRARISSLPHDDLIILDRSSRQLHVLTENTDAEVSASGRHRAASFDIQGEPVAVLPMRLNMHARNGLVILQSGHSSPSVVLPQTISPTSPQILVVRTTADDGVDSLRQAILDANSNPGPDGIIFEIASGPQTISPLSPLPLITDTVFIDGTTQPGFAGSPIIEINGANAGPGITPGLFITAVNCLVRGLVINRFGGSGIRIETNGSNIIEGNFLGTDITGTLDLGNGEHGVITFEPSTGNIIGGTTAAARNVISGNSRGVEIADGNLVQGNFIGTNADGTAALGNSASAIFVESANTIGGTTAGARNVISGGLSVGIFIVGPADGNLVQGNFIGTNATGNAQLANAVDGVFVFDAPNNTFGGTAPGAGNVISGNNDNGIFILGAGATNNIIQGNVIGADGNGSFPIQNTEGILIVNASRNIIGGGVPEARNLISGNTGNGIHIVSGATGNFLQSNFIGIDLSLPPNPLGNGGNGILIESDNNIIGGTSFGVGNITAFNSGDGIRVASGNGNAILLGPGSGFIYSNAGLGIDLGGDGPTANDPGDGDTGANDLQNFPVLTSSDSDGSTISIEGTFNSTPNTSFRIEFLSSESCDPSGFGEGRDFVGSTNIVTDGSGNSIIDSDFNIPVAPGRAITAKATNLSNTNTSEFSQCVTVDARCAITCPANIFASNSPGQCGAVVNYPIPAISPGCGSVSCAPPSGAFFPLGTTNVNCTFSAEPGCAFTVTVNDTQAPAVTCPPDITDGLTSGQCSAIVSYQLPTISDNCSGANISCDPPSGSRFFIGVTIVNCVARDAANNSTACSFTVTVSDMVAPTISCPLNITVPGEANQCSAVVRYPSPGVSDNCPGAAATCSPPTNTRFPVGATTITCTATDAASNTAACSFTVTVEDTQSPAIICLADLTAQATASNGALVNYPLPVVSDNCSGASAVCSPPSGSTFPIGVTAVNCAATDTSGNRTNCGFTVIVESVVASLAISNASVNEGNSGTTSASFTVTLFPASSRTVSVNFATANGSATAGIDYIANAGSLTFSPNETTKTITVIVNGDTLSEANETFFVNLSGAVNATVADQQGLGTITNEDGSPRLFISDAEFIEGNSGTSTASFTVSLTPASGQIVTVAFATADGIATAGGDYLATTGTLIFNPGDTSRTVNVMIIGDSNSEPEETFLVNLSNAVNATIARRRAIGTIANDDIIPTLVDLGIEQTASSSTIASGERITYHIVVRNNSNATATDVSIIDNLPTETTFASVSTTGVFTAPSVGTTGTITCSLGAIGPGAERAIDITANVLAVAGSAISNMAIVTTSSTDQNSSNDQTVLTTNVIGGALIELAWEQITSTVENPTPAPVNVQVRMANTLSTNSASTGNATRLAATPCTLVQVNIYKAERLPVETTSANLWKVVPPDELKTAITAAPSGSFYRLTNTWDCGTSSESDPSNGAAVPAGPNVTGVKISSKIKATGTGFMDGIQLFIDGVGFKKNAKLKGVPDVIQKGRLEDGRSLGDVATRGRTVLIIFRNRNGGFGSFSFTRQ